ncbi:hypothetical protein HPP92_001260, partial [Vanilla planifolia]
GRKSGGFVEVNDLTSTVGLCSFVELLFCKKSFEFPKGKGSNKGSHHSKAFGSRSKPTPSKWDDAQKWLSGFSNGGADAHSKSKPRNSNAEDRDFCILLRRGAGTLVAVLMWA